jgi:predicted  nucleic acid-binding Zn-ribbon protein
MTNVAIRAGELARRDRASTTLDQIAFFSAFVLGTGSIVGLKVAAMSQILVTAAPIGLMLLYLSYVLWTRHFSLGDDRIGDNLYYLGFLFTLVSIAYSLYEFTSSKDAAHSIIVNFGIALATTIVGVALRVSLMQVRGDPAEIERIARTELSEVALRLSTELDLAVQALNKTRIANEQAMAETTINSASSVKRALSEMANASETFNTLAKQGSEAIKDKLTTVLNNASALNSAATTMVTAAEALWKRIDAIDVPRNLLERKLASVARQLTESATAMERAAKGTDSVATSLTTATTALTEHSSALDAAAKEHRRHVDELKSVDPGLQGLTERWLELSKAIEQQRIAMSNLAPVSADLQAVQAQREAIRQQVTDATRLLIEMEQALVATARRIVEQVNAAG